MADFPNAHWMGELVPHKTAVTTLGCPIHGFIVENSTNTETSIPWQADTHYSVGDFHDEGTHHYEVTAVQSDQHSGVSAPTWPTDGSSVQDNNVTWTDRGLIGQETGVYDVPLGTKEHEAFASGVVSDHQAHNSCQLVQVPGIAEVTRSPAEQVLDAAHRHRWQNYALIVNNSLHGRPLHWPWTAAYPYLDQQHGALYIDDNGVPWGIEVQARPIVTTNAWNVQVWMRCLFGRVGRAKDLWDLEEDPANADGLFRQLANLYISGPVVDIPNSPSTYKVNNDTGFVLTRNSRGSVMFAHLYQHDNGIGTFRDAKGDKYLLRAVVRLEFSGNGLVTDTTVWDGPLGDGISCTATLHRGKDDVYKVESSVIDQSILFSPSQAIGESIRHDRTHHAPSVPDCLNNLEYAGFTDYFDALVHPDGSTWGSPNPILQDNYRNDYTYLWRCTFDENDNEIDIAYRKRVDDYADIVVGVTGHPRSVITHWPGDWESGGVACDPVDPETYEVVDSGPITNSITGNFGTDTKHQLLVGGAVVEEVVIRSNTYRHNSHTGPAGRSDLDGDSMLESSVAWNAGTETTSQTVDGQADERSYSIQPHIYSLDILGLVITRQEEGPGATPEHVLSAVATPGGVESTHKGVTFSDDYPSLSGAYHPKTKEVVWNQPGLTDMGEGNTFSFV